MNRREEIGRQRRVSDEMTTMYSVLRDRYARRARCLTLSIFFASIVFVTATFLQDSDLSQFGVSAGGLRLAMGIASAVVLFASVAELTLRWREVSQSYGDAAQRTARAKADAREALVLDEEIDEGRFK